MTTTVLLLLVLAIHAAAAAARASVVGAWSLSFDEAFSWRMSRYPAAEVVARTARDVHPPAYYLILKGWTRWSGDSPESMRMMSVILAALAGLALHGLLLEATTPAGGGPEPAGPEQGRVWSCLLAAVLVSTSPLISRHAVEARMYPLAAASAILAGWALLAALRRGARPSAWWVIYAGASALCCYVHNYGPLAVAALSAYLATWCLSRSGRSAARLLSMPEARRGLLATAAVALAYLPWLLVALAQSRQIGADYATGPIDAGQFASEVGHLFTGLYWLAEPPLPAVWCAGLAILLALLASGPERPDRALAFLIAGPIALGVLASLVVGRSVLFSRYCYPSAFAIAGGLAVLIARLPGPTTRAIASALAVTTTAGLTASMYERIDPERHPGLLGATTELARRWRPGEAVFTSHADVYLVLQLESRRRGFASPRLIRADRRPLSHYKGGPVIDVSEIVTPEEAAASDGPSAWVVEARMAGRFATPLLPGWRRIDERSFPEVRITARDMVFLDRLERGPAPRAAAVASIGERGRRP